ncbi:4-alpha-glucanotransferase [Luteimonas sp. SDU82]|uniref:4-alpha-glucanotransferase n=1 Tax=Luteimonas sp. SDU82 TaxID=3422592 RepID=UPI003EBFEB71
MNERESALHALAAAAGLCRDWTDVEGRPQTVAEGTLRAVLDALDLPAATPAQCRDSLQRLDQVQADPPLLTARACAPVAAGPGPALRQWLSDAGEREDVRVDARGRVRAPAQPGYWTLQGGEPRRVAVAPARCFGVEDSTARGRAWGVALQVYSARAGGDGGIGDTLGCAGWVDRVAARGGDALALSPVHAALEGDRHYSPYAPGDRRCLDPLHASPLQVFGEVATQVLAHAPELQARLRALEADDLIDWRAARAAKWAWLARLHADALPLRADLQQDFAAFAAAPPGEVAAWASFVAHGDADAASLQLFGQWLARRAWAQCQQRARGRGMGIGLVADLAVGFDPSGAEAAAHPAAVLRGLELGAPPDAFNADGQAWGISGYSPTGLRQTGFAPFIELLRAVMRDRGGVRIDHILGLQRLWVVPRGAGAGEGVYLSCPLDALLDLLALESWRHRCVVIGEDLGVVPPGIRALLARRGVLGIDVLPFTRDRRGRFLPPRRWRKRAVATTTTHDLPSTAGWREGRDIAWRLGLHEATAAALHASAPWPARATDVRALERAIRAQSIDTGHARLDALHFTARSPALLALLPAEDALGLREQPNLPGTTDSHPNWRRRLPEPLPEAVLQASLSAFAQARQEGVQ